MQNKSSIGLLDEVTATLTILAAAWSKTAFAITLLRIVDGWAKKSVWVIIVTMNCTMLLSVILGWAQCSPPEKIWKPELPGACLPREIRTNYNIFSGGEQILDGYTLFLKPSRHSNGPRPKSIRGRDGPLSRSPALDDPPQFANEDKREDWSRRRDEYGGSVSHVEDLLIIL